MVVIDVASRLPQHVDQRGVVLAVQWNVLRQLRTEAEIRDTNHAAPGSGTLHSSAFRLRRLSNPQQHIFWNFKNIFDPGTQLSGMK